ncbi:nitrogenase [Candidatus Poribacteria bacterium]|nr:nitrogenase [Candidatus Poribacteria bacterium]
MKEKNSTINPCYHCMPLGAIFAGYGFEKTITLIHGSQGCATYMRRHLSRHFHEPIDTASSSLNEKDAIYGGEDNLKKAIKNVCEQYNPKMIIVASTCLSETIGDDVDLVVNQSMNDLNIPIVYTSTPSFQGSYSAGYFRTIKAIIKKICIKRIVKNSFINIIPGIISPQDLRHLETLGDLLHINFHILGDYSENLDGMWTPFFKLMPNGGTPLNHLEEAGSAIATIEFSVTNSIADSPALFLQQEFGVPAYRIPYPNGLSSVDKFINILQDITGKNILENISMPRGRLLDAMIDTHKILFGKKVAIFGESDFVYSTIQIIKECGMEVIVVVCEKEHELISRQFTMIISNGSMFELEHYINNNDVDLLLGPSTGSTLSHKLNIPLVRRSFPIHDRYGAGRILSIMYEGTITLIDDIANALTEKIHSSFRDNLKKSYL